MNEWIPEVNITDTNAAEQEEKKQKCWLRIDLISAVPQTFASVLASSILGRAQKNGVVEIVVHNLHDYGIGKYQQIDDTPFGGGAGMVLRCEPIFTIIEHLQTERIYDEVIFMTPDGKRFEQSDANALSLKKNIIILAGHYKGIDQRVRDTLVTKEISIGDYVLTGGELPALVLTDAIVRLLPGAMSDAESALLDSFQENVLDTPHYTKPAEFRGQTVPEVLLSGNHAAIERWKRAESLKKTQERRPDLLQ